MSDPVVDEVREVRHRISRRVGHDPARLVAYYIDLQKQYQGRLIGTPDAAEVASAEADAGLAGDRGGPAARAVEPGR